MTVVRAGAPEPPPGAPPVPGPAAPPPDEVDEVPRGVDEDPDHEAEFVAFVAASSGPLGRTAWLLCGDRHTAEELVQAALVRTYLRWPTARERDPLAYARRTLVNLRISGWRRRRREVLVDPSAVPERTVGHGADAHAERDRLVRALAALTPRQRRVVVLRHVEDLPEREVADLLGVSVGTVKSTASRALAVLRDRLEQDPAGTDPGAAGPLTRRGAR
ncbi:SigE family RNA polymerase sigma factor [Cellulomonas endophytica]|uniref:SigE family RNA polymerase sigma factor n=1 Tax=Cellulomonas endophytica TaxID=2494735 RepID=UPI00101366AD|nr:SigE family RNA polymerase sigma factor [Cellulomonas endophytica]